MGNLHRMDFIQRLSRNAFDQLDTTGHTIDVHGWMDPSFAAIFTKHLPTNPKTDPLVVVEVGSWKGLSTSTMAKACKDAGIPAKIVAVDTWLGAPEFWTWGLDDSTRGVSLRLENGFPTVFYTFTKNMKALGYDDIVAPLPLASQCAYDVLQYYKIQADIVYVDAAHEYESVKQDIQTYWNILKPGGVMIGDDYCTYWSGVKHAVDEVFGNAVHVEGVVWYVHKPHAV